MAQFKTKFDSKRQDWETPAVLFDPLNNEFGFTLDVCATAENAKCKSYFTIADNGLAQVWKGICWMNPPFGEQGKWVHKAYQSAQEGATVVCLLPSRTNTNWWHDVCMKGEVRFIRGRPKFVGAEHGLPQPLSVVVFTPPNTACTGLVESSASQAFTTLKTLSARQVLSQPATSQ